MNCNSLVCMVKWVHGFPHSTLWGCQLLLHSFCWTNLRCSAASQIRMQVQWQHTQKRALDYAWCASYMGTVWSYTATYFPLIYVSKKFLASKSWISSLRHSSQTSFGPEDCLVGVSRKCSRWDFMIFFMDDTSLCRLYVGVHMERWWNEHWNKFETNSEEGKPLIINCTLQ